MTPVYSWVGERLEVLTNVCITDSKLSGMKINEVLLSYLIQAYESRREGR